MSNKSNYFGDYLKPIIRSYNLISFMAIIGKWTKVDFLNLGYVGFNLPFDLDSTDKENTLFISLYAKLFENIPKEVQSALEIGSGLGGGCYLIKKYYKIPDVTGIDFARLSVWYSKIKYKPIGITYKYLQAEKAINLKRRFDLIFSLEASLLFYNREKFFENIPQLLNKNGLFFYADFFSKTEIIIIETLILKYNLKILSKEDISHGVIKSIKNSKPRAQEGFLINNIKKILRIKEIEKFDAHNNSDIHKKLISGDFVYLKYIISKDLQ